MKLTRISIILLLITLSSCENDKRIVSDKTELHSYTPVRNEVTFLAKDSVSPFTANISSTIYNTNYETMYFSLKNDIPLVIPTDSIINLRILYNYKYRLNLSFKKGDTIYFSQKTIFIDGKEKVDYPYFTVSPRKVNPYELNFDYYVSKKTPTINTYPFYKLFNDYSYKNNKSSKVILNYTDVINNTISVLDSFHDKKKITTSFYNSKLKEIQIDKSISFIYEAKKLKKKLDFSTVSVSLSDTIMYNNEKYLNFLKAYVSYTYFLNSKINPTFSDRFDTVLNKEKKIETKLKNAILYDYLQSIYLGENEKFMKRYSQFKLLLPEKNYINSFEYQLSEAKKDEIHNNKNSASTGKLITLDSASILDLKDVIKKEKGKVILVDFWASWCAPCRMEMPSLKKLQMDIDNEKLAIISISTDESYTSWETASRIEGLDKAKHNYLLINAKNSSIIKDFKINTIPRYLLYDKNGQLINDNAPRPTDERLKKIIFSYLKK